MPLVTLRGVSFRLPDAPFLGLGSEGNKWAQLVTSSLEEIFGGATGGGASTSDPQTWEQTQTFEAGLEVPSGIPATPDVIIGGGEVSAWKVGAEILELRGGSLQTSNTGLNSWQPLIDGISQRIHADLTLGGTSYDGRFVLTHNAVWDAASSAWKAQGSGQCVQLRFGAGEVSLWSFTASSAGQTVTWTQKCTIDAEGYIRLSGAVPAADVGFTNTLTSKNLVRAWGVVQVSAGSASVVAGFNVASVLVSGVYLIDVTLKNGMTNTNYAVVASSADETIHYCGYANSTTHFYIKAHNIWNNSSFSFNSGTNRLLFAVLGV